MHECSVSHTPVLLVEINPQSGSKNPPDTRGGSRKSVKKDE